MMFWGRRYRHYRQRDAMDCGAACLYMIAESLGGKPSYSDLVAATHKSRQGVSVLNLCGAAEELGLNAKALMCTVTDLRETRSLPCVLHWNQNHYVVVHDIRGKHAIVSDPNATGIVRLTLDELEAGWLSVDEGDEQYGVAVFFAATDTLRTSNNNDSAHSFSLSSLVPHLNRERRAIGQLFLTMLVGLLLTMALPLFTQAQIDTGVSLGDMRFLEILLVGQFLVITGQGLSHFFRRWILVYLSARVNHGLITAFVGRLLKLPMKFFDERNFGDILARLEDHKKIELFLSSNAFEIVFILLSLGLYSLLLASYSLLIFCVFIAGVALILFWTRYFMAARRTVDFKRFSLIAQSHLQEVQLIAGTQEMRLSSCENLYREEWQATQAQLFHAGIHSMKIEQSQLVGATFLLQTLSILCAFLAASLVLEGSFTLGMMMAVSLIIGQLSAPLAQGLEFSKLAQDALIATERIQDVYQTSTEQEQQRTRPMNPDTPSGTLTIQGISFRYDDPEALPVLDDLSLSIAEGGTTAIVGESGSGKTTLLKLLFKLYEPEKGIIRVGGHNLQNIDVDVWRRQCGVVMQDGYVFSDSILRNITFEDHPVDPSRLDQVLDLACVREFVDRLPYGIMTKVGNDGLALSGGQKQRLLIARALYKRPRYMFFDEATSALDTENEKKIVENLDRDLQQCTRIVVAHRLSTVRRADHIVVLAQGRVVEQGKHDQLILLRGRYFQLVSEQLSLASS